MIISKRNDNGELQIIDKEYLKNELSNSSLDVTVNDVENYVNQYNKTMQGKMVKSERKFSSF